MHLSSFLPLFFTLFLADAKRITTLNGAQLHVGIFDFPPMFTVGKDEFGNAKMTGIAGDVLEIMVDHFNVTMNYVIANPSNIVKYGIESALYRLLDRDVDFVPYWFQTTLEAMDHMEPIYPFWVVHFTLLQPWPNEKSRLDTPIRPFTPEVWVMFAVSLAAFTISISVLIKSVDKRNRNSIELVSKHFEYVMSVITLQGSNIPHEAKLPTRLVIASFLLAMIVLVYAYTGVLTAMLTIPKLEPVFNSFEEVANSPHAKVTVGKRSIFADQFLAAESGSYKMIGDSLRREPHLITSQFYQMFENVMNLGCVYPAVLYCSTEMANAIIRDDLTKSNGKCRLTCSLEPLPSFNALQVGMKKGSPYAPLINRFIMAIRDHGLVLYLRDKHIPVVNKCRVDHRPRSKVRPLNFEDLTSAFIVLGMGVLLSFIIFVVQLIKGKFCLNSARDV